jgi:hypothetical protein
MEDYDEHVSTRGVGVRDSAGVGYVIIPPDFDRTKYIEEVFRSGKISLGLEQGGVVENVIVSQSVFNYLEFPSKPAELGSMIFWTNIPKYNQPIAIAVLTKAGEMIGLSEKQIVINKSDKDGYIEISGNAKGGNLIIKAIGRNESTGQLDIIVGNVNKSGKLNINVKGSAAITCDGNIDVNVTKILSIKIADPAVDDIVTELRYERGSGLTYVDEFNNEITINGDKISMIHHDGLKQEITKDSVIFNGGEIGGMVNASALVTELNKTNALLNTILAVLSGPPIPEAGNTAPSALQAALSLALKGQQLGDYSQIENDKVKH